MIVKNIVITADEKTKIIKISIKDSKMDANKKENESSRMIDILMESLKDDKIKAMLKKGVDELKV